MAGSHHPAAAPANRRKKLTTKTGVNAGKSPSLASVYRALAGAGTLAKTN